MLDDGVAPVLETFCSLLASGWGTAWHAALAFCSLPRRAVYKPDVSLNNLIDLPASNSKAYRSYLEFIKSVYPLYWF